MNLPEATLPGAFWGKRQIPLRRNSGRCNITLERRKLCYAVSVSENSAMRAAIIVLALFAINCSCEYRSRGAKLNLPDIMLWAWQRAEDLSFIDTRSTGVAYLAGTVRIQQNGFPQFEPRLQPLHIAAGTPLLAVVRIETTASNPRAQTAPLVQALQQVMHQPAIRGLQIDFDARASERAFYRSLLSALGEQSPVPVGVTALASWCEGDRWLENADIAEAVPMFFRMGKDETRNMRVTLSSCVSSIGLSTDEPWPMRRPPGLQRIYVFNPRAWDRDAYFRTLRRVNEWKAE